MLLVLRDDDGSVLEFDELGEGKVRIRLADGLTQKTGETVSTFDNYPSVMTIMVQAHQLITQLRPPSLKVEVTSDATQD